MEPSRPGEVFAVIAMVHHMAIRRKALRPPVDGFFAAGYAAGKQSSSQMPYEAGMQIVFDLVDRTVVVSFRDTVKMLGPYADRKEAIHAGEQFCRDRGWDDSLSPALGSPRLSADGVSISGPGQPWVG